jgi:anthranilate phosphoribosyltransferase
MSQAFSQYIKIIGKGKKGAKPLTREQAYTAMKMVLNGEVTGEQRGAFLMLLRTREETADELIGFVDACREGVDTRLTHLDVALDIGCYAGKRRQLLWYLLAVACLVKNGVKVFLHGAHEFGSNRLYASHVLPQLGLASVDSLEAAKAQSIKYGASYADLSLFHPQLYQVIQLREQFALRSCANTLARLLNPSAAPNTIQGVYHLHLDERHFAVNQAYSQYNSLCFRGDGGDPEVNQERETALYFTQNGQASTLTLSGAEQFWSLKDRDLDCSEMLSVWRGEQQHPYGNQAVLGSLAAYLMLLQNLPQEQAFQQAQQLWNSRDKQALPFAPLD